jgi:hypothetical protein
VRRARRRVGVFRDRQDRGLRRQGLGPDRPVHDRDQVDDRQLQDEHQEDDLDHGPVILGVKLDGKAGKQGREAVESDWDATRWPLPSKQSNT